MPASKVVGIITKNKALGSILAMILRDNTDIRVRKFDSVNALKIYLKIAPIHLLICDYDLTDLSCAHLIASLKSDPKMHTENMQTMALTQGIDRKIQQEIGIAGIDEIIVKPMSPQYVFERVQARIAMPQRFKRVPAKRTKLTDRLNALVQMQGIESHLSENVVPLFGNMPHRKTPERV